MGIFVGYICYVLHNDQVDVLLEETITTLDKWMLLSMHFLVGLSSSLPF